MTEGPGAKDAPHTFTDGERARGQDVSESDQQGWWNGLEQRERQAVLAWVGDNLTQVRRSVYDEQRILRNSLVIGFVIGLAAHVGGFLLKSSATTDFLGLVADLLYALGFALWTGVVVVVFVQIYPETKRRQFKWALDAYEAAMRDRARAGSDRTSGDDGAPTAG